jgi:hypothetical protein
LLQLDIGDQYAIWPIAAGGWTTVNETAFLAKNPDIVTSSHFFIWEYMNGGLSALNPWPGEYVYPSRRPLMATWFLARKYILPRFLSIEASELPPLGAVNPVNAQNFEAEIASLAKITAATSARQGPVGLILAYPGKAELQAARRGEEWLDNRPELERIAHANNLAIIDLAQNRAWNDTLYRDRRAMRCWPASYRGPVLMPRSRRPAKDRHRA